MRHRFQGTCERSYAEAPARVRRDFDKQLRLLLDQGHRYPPLRIHPWPADGPDTQQAYVNIHWRFYYYVDGDTYVIYNLTPHPKTSQRGW